MPAQPPDDFSNSTPKVSPSRFAAEMRRLPERTRRMTRLEPASLEILDAIMDGAKVLVDDTDRRPVAEKLEAIFKGVDPAVGGAFAERITQLDEDTITHVVRFYSRRDYQRYLRRMLGEGDSTVFARPPRRTSTSC